MLHSVAPTLQQATTDPHCHLRLLDTRRQVRVSLCGVTAPFSWVLLCTKFCLCLQESVSPVLCKFRQLHGGVNGELLQEGLCHTQVCCTQSPSPCVSPLLTCTSTGDTKIQFYLSLCGVSGSWGTQGLSEQAEHLWQEWGWILNVNSPLILLGLLLCPWTWGIFAKSLEHLAAATPVPTSCWGFSALGCRVSSHSNSGVAQSCMKSPRW